MEQNEFPSGSVRPAPGYRKVSIESVTKCYGNCDGCTLSEDERRDEGGPQARALDWATSFTRDALSVVRKHDDDGGSFVVFGQGEHLTVDPVERIADLAKRASAQSITINEFTTALLMPNEQARSMLKRVYDRSLEHPVALLPNIVFSPRKVLPSGFRKEYLSNIESAVSIFGISDFTVNLGADVIDIMTPKEFDDLVTLSGIRSMEINLIPVDGSAPLMRRRWGEIMRWMIRLLELWLPNRRKYRLAYPISLSMLIEKTFGATVQEALPYLREHFANELYVDLGGSVYLAGSGGAGVTVPFYGKNGYRAVATGYPVFDARLEALLYEQAGRTAMSMSVAHMRYAACRRCPYLVSCIASGFTPVLTQFRLDPVATGENCPLGVADLMRVTQDAMRSSSIYDMDIFHGHVAQRGLKDLVNERVLHAPEEFQSPIRVDFNAAAAGSITRVMSSDQRLGPIAPVKPKFAMKVVVEAQDLRELDLHAIGRAIAALQGDAAGEGVWEEGSCDFESYLANAELMSAEQWDEFIAWAGRAIGAQGAISIGVRPRDGEGLERALSAAQRLCTVVAVAMPEVWFGHEELPGGSFAAEALETTSRIVSATSGVCALHLTLDERLCRSLPPQDLHDWIVRTGATKIVMVIDASDAGDLRSIYGYLSMFEAKRVSAGLRFSSELIDGMEEALRSVRGASEQVIEERLRARMATCVMLGDDGGIHPLLTNLVVDGAGLPIRPMQVAPARVDAIEWVAMRRAIRETASQSIPDALPCQSCSFRMACALAGVPRASSDDGRCPSGVKGLWEPIARRIDPVAEHPLVFHPAVKGVRHVE